MDVDDNGWIHVAYYQNETGIVDGGVLNASTANLYYTLSVDGGLTWAPHVQINDSGNALDYFDPPLDLSSRSYYLIGDYCQIKAATSGGTRPYVYWSGYDKDIHSIVGQTYCTTITIRIADLNGDGIVGIQDLFIMFGNWGSCPQPCPPACLGDIDNDCFVDITDLFILFGNWG